MSQARFELIFEHRDCERRIQVRRGETYLIGRSSTASFFLGHGSVSRRHATLIGHSHGVELQDLGSRNGIFLDGRRIDRFFLGESQIVQVGRVPFTVSVRPLPGVTLRCARSHEPLTGWRPWMHAVGLREMSAAHRARELEAQTDQMCGFLVDEGFEPEAVLSRRPFSALVAHPQLREQKFRVKAIPLPLHDNDQEFKRFRKLARSAAGLEVAGLQRIIDVRSANDILYVITEAPVGPSLEALIAQSGPLPLARALALTRGLLQTLEECAAEKVTIHGLCPELVCVAPDGPARIMDVHIDGAFRVMSARAELDGEDARWLAPELLAEALAGDERADIYSAAALLVYMLTGRAPFAELPARLPARMALLGITLRPSLEGVPEALRPCLWQLLDPDPTRRPRTAAEAQARLNDAAAEALVLPDDCVHIPHQPPVEAFSAAVLPVQLREVFHALQRHGAHGRLEVIDPEGRPPTRVVFAAGGILEASAEGRSGAPVLEALRGLRRANLVFDPDPPGPAPVQPLSTEGWA